MRAGERRSRGGKSKSNGTTAQGKGNKNAAARQEQPSSARPSTAATATCRRPRRGAFEGAPSGRGLVAYLPPGTGSSSRKWWNRGWMVVGFGLVLKREAFLPPGINPRFGIDEKTLAFRPAEHR